MSKFYAEGSCPVFLQNNGHYTENELAAAEASGQVLQARAVLCDAEHDLVVDLGCMQGRIPRREGALGIREGQVRDIAIISRVNKPVCFVVERIVREENGRTTALLSRRAAQQRCRQEYLDILSPGDIIPARITHMEPFGVFADIGCGVVSLLPIDAISISRISHPGDRFCAGQEIFVVVSGRDDTGRICLSHKELLGSWEENAAGFCAGQTVSGIVRTVEDYGAFIELTPNLAGLAELRPGIRVGQQASVYIKSLNPEKMKIKLILVDAFHADYAPPPLRYYRCRGHMDVWQYSPAGCGKCVRTVFSEP